MDRQVPGEGAPTLISTLPTESVALKCVSTATGHYTFTYAMGTNVTRLLDNIWFLVEYWTEVGVSQRRECEF